MFPSRSSCRPKGRGTLVTAGLVVSCLCATVPLPAGERYQNFDDPKLVVGKQTWLTNCEGCHGYGIAGAPVPMLAPQWRERIQKDLDVLYEHALEGFFGPGGTMMPARGGNDSLTDDQVRGAVDYMLALARFHVEKPSSANSN